MVCCCALAGTAACNNCFNRTGNYSYSINTTTFPDIKKTQNNPIIINYNYIIQGQEKKKKKKK
jgi:hypothetical protein